MLAETTTVAAKLIWLRCIVPEATFFYSRLFVPVLICIISSMGESSLLRRPTEFLIFNFCISLLQMLWVEMSNFLLVQKVKDLKVVPNTSKRDDQVGEDWSQIQIFISFIQFSLFKFLFSSFILYWSLNNWKWPLRFK